MTRDEFDAIPWNERRLPVVFLPNGEVFMGGDALVWEAWMWFEKIKDMEFTTVADEKYKNLFGSEND